ncbi:hypothetical protein INT47_009056 [Mucor saturninus]|uniref:Uncharacterized protein n=1 Tax=Mucor saturninus TaxID=64648 RepID=A0A8H7VEC5_9FUNG|nr:hypothetical protein INT47_009056 [Mucor saturninus]
MLPSKYNLHFKYCGNETDYPFELSNNSFTAIKKSMEGSRQLIPASCFKAFSTSNHRSIISNVPFQRVRVSYFKTRYLSAWHT